MGWVCPHFLNINESIILFKDLLFSLSFSYPQTGTYLFLMTHLIYAKLTSLSFIRITKATLGLHSCKWIATSPQELRRLFGIADTLKVILVYQKDSMLTINPV